MEISSGLAARCCTGDVAAELGHVRRAIEAFNRRDGAKFDALLTDDVEIVPVRAALEGTT